MRILASIAPWLAALSCHPGGAAVPELGAAARRDKPVSNIMPSDYAGSEACASCHPDQYASWLDSPMHNMTRDARTAQIRAPFTGQAFVFRGDRAVMLQREAERFVALDSRDGSESLFRVTKVIGGRYREDFVGVQVDPAAPFGASSDEERILPASYLIFSGEWRYKGYSVMVKQRPRLEPGVVWRETCIGCHNTAATFTLLYDDLYGPGAPSYQGSARVDLPDSRRAHYRIVDDAGLRQALATQMAELGATLPADIETQEALEDTMNATRGRFGERALVELGIGCEACHGGSREHALDPRQSVPSFGLESPFFVVENADGSEPSSAQDLNRSCAKCHTVLFSRYPFTWEDGTHRQPGGSSTNSGEARDYQLGGCSEAMRCTSCHDPHTEDPPRALEQLAGPRGTALCTSCHQGFGSPQMIAAHTHHAPESTGSACINCHMPKKNMGLAYSLSRYHRIGSPTDPERVEGDRPLECALCHTDWSVGRIVESMERLWNKRYDRQALAKLYGSDLRINALEATLFWGKPHEQAVAVVLAGRDRQAQWLTQVAATLESPYPLLRFFARDAIERITGSRLDLDLNAPADEIRAEVTRQFASAAHASVDEPAP